ncbi:hypothetical protein OR1_00247 [Geobacter sp. OR-1]|uniref:hypothetical protein n=1 Tax=Geobacter sp. OR-1 TaxID=1266765 RepID=UPI0005438D00|nr:hypothetical protein [Geobacter sp. OR-1]GAM07978.1 hypothetical protein OR1_00247 [Geobacter sp. OR-1]
MNELILAFVIIGFTSVALGTLFFVVDFLRWKAREQGSDLLVKIVDQDHCSLSISRGMLTELLACGKILKYRDGRRWVKVGHA